MHMDTTTIAKCRGPSSNIRMNVRHHQLCERALIWDARAEQSTVAPPGHVPCPSPERALLDSTVALTTRLPPSHRPTGPA